MSRKIARTFYSITKTMLISLPLLAVMTVSCGDDNDKDKDEPEAPKEEEINSVVGTWQKYQRVQDDGSLTSADPDEFWIFDEDKSFLIEDSGNITDAGTYSIDGNILIITMSNLSDPREIERYRGFFEIKDGYMNYQYADSDNDWREYRFRKIK